MHYDSVELSLITRNTELGAPPQPEDFLYPSIIIWNPFEDHNLEKTIKCPQCQAYLHSHEKYWADGTQSYQPRTLYSFDHTVLLVSRVYMCFNRQILLAHDERLHKALSKSIDIPFILQHKTGYTKEFINKVVTLSNNGMNFFKIESMCIEEHWNYHCVKEQKFWQVLKEYKSQHPFEEIPTISFPKFKKDGIPSNDAIAQCFLKDFMEKEYYYVSEMTQLTSDVWISCDHTFKVASNIGYLREDNKWVRQYSAVFLVLNNEGKVLSWQFTNSTCFSYIQKLLTNLKQRFERLGTKIQKIAVDNCCQWRNKLQDIFGDEITVCLDVFHAVQRISRTLPKKHKLYHQCIGDLRLVFRTGGDIGLKRCKATPLPDEMLRNMDNFVKEWKNVSHFGKPLFSSETLHEIEKLKFHITKGCLSNIEVGCGTNRNEALHRHMNSFFHQSRISILLAYALMTVLIYSHNSIQESKPKRIIKPISAIISEEVKGLYLSSSSNSVSNSKEYFGILPKDLPFLPGTNDSPFYDKVSNECEENSTFDLDSVTLLLSKSVQQCMVASKLKDCKQLQMCTVMQKEIEKLIISPKDTNTINDQFLSNLLTSNDLELIPMAGDGNCCFSAVGKGLQCILEENFADKSSFVKHINFLQLQISDLQQLSLRLRKLTVDEWSGCNKSFYENFLTSSQSIDDAAIKFSEPGYYQNDVGDLMILALCNVLHVPIIIFSNIPNQPVIPVLPQETRFDVLLFVAYNHIGEGHYDAVAINKKNLLKSVSNSFCRCGVNGDRPSCCNTEVYQTRCKCFKRGSGCSQFCKCKNCSNKYGKRIINKKRNRMSHEQRSTLPNSREFAEGRLEKIKYGPWNLLENVILTHVVANFAENLEELTTENILKGYNEVVSFSRMPHCPIEIPDYIMGADLKSLVQLNGKLFRSSLLPAENPLANANSCSTIIPPSVTGVSERIGET